MGEAYANGSSSLNRNELGRVIVTDENGIGESVIISMIENVVIGLKKQQLSEKLSGMRLIYIYHNTIDARGDNASTENEVFDATDKAFKELSGLVRKLRNDIANDIQKRE